MKPNEPIDSQDGVPLSNQRVNLVSKNSSNQEAAANIIRSQIDNLYSSNVTTPKRVEATKPAPKTDIDTKTHIHSNTTEDSWKRYHSAWQNYYQKYYESYYIHHLKLATNQQQKQAEDPENKKKNDEEAVFYLRQRLIGKVHESATKIKKSRHFWPIASGVATILVLLLVQYNRTIISTAVAYISPGNIDPQNIIINPNSSLAVGPDSRLIIPKINVDVPVTYDIGSDYDSQMAAMKNGLAHFAIPGARSHPGQIGNTVIAGHSSNDLFDSGNYKFIFAQLEKLNVGDTIYANYNSIRYTYAVTGKEVVNPTDVDKLVYATDKSIITLVTCTPLGTATNRLFVIAEQINPDPTKLATAPATTKGSVSTASIPGNSPTLFELIFGSSRY